MNLSGTVTFVIFYSGGYALTYFALELGLWACVISAGFFTGLGLCFSGAVLVTSAMKVCKENECSRVTQLEAILLQWFPGKRGAVGSIVIAGSGFGATLWIPLQTLFVNPNNIAAVEVEGQEDRCLDVN